MHAEFEHEAGVTILVSKLESVLIGSTQFEPLVTEMLVAVGLLVVAKVGFKTDCELAVDDPVVEELVRLE